MKVGCFSGENRHTTRKVNGFMRLPMYYGLAREDQEPVVSAIEDFIGCE